MSNEKLTPEQRAEALTSDASDGDLGRRFGVTPAAIYALRRRALRPSRGWAPGGDREGAVAFLWSRGLSAAEIADRVDIHRRSVVRYQQTMREQAATAIDAKTGREWSDLQAVVRAADLLGLTLGDVAHMLTYQALRRREGIPADHALTDGASPREVLLTMAAAGASVDEMAARLGWVRRSVTNELAALRREPRLN